MNDAWKRIFKEYVACYESIQILESNSIAVDDDAATLRYKLLEDIIETMKTEIEE